MPTPKNHPTQKNTTIQPLSINSLLKFARARQCTHQRSSDFWSYHAAYIYSRVRCVCISSINLYIGIHWSRWAWSAYFLFLRAHRATNLSALETNNYRPPRARQQFTVNRRTSTVRWTMKQNGSKVATGWLVLMKSEDLSISCPSCGEIKNVTDRSRTLRWTQHKYTLKHTHSLWIKTEFKFVFKHLWRSCAYILMRDVRIVWRSSVMIVISIKRAYSMNIQRPTSIVARKLSVWIITMQSPCKWYYVCRRFVDYYLVCGWWIILYICVYWWQSDVRRRISVYTGHRSPKIQYSSISDVGVRFNKVYWLTYGALVIGCTSRQTYTSTHTHTLKRSNLLNYRSNSVARNGTVNIVWSTGAVFT